MKPYVILNAAMTLDGKIATKTGSSNISGKEDLIRVHKLRKEVDGIMVGINTVIVDNPRLTIHKIEEDSSKNPIRVVVDSKGRTPLASRVVNNEAPTIIAVANNYKNDLILTDRWSILEKKAEFYFNGDKEVDLNDLLNYLYDKGIKTLMVEGGSTLNFSLLKEGLIDEIRVCVAPMVVGGIEAKSLFGGDGFDTMDEAVKLELFDYFSLGKDLILQYKVVN